MFEKRRLVLAAAATIVFLGLIYPIKADTDLWGHLRFGLDTLENGELTAVNTYSYTAPDYPWVNHEWLFEVLLALAYKTFGTTGLVGFLWFWMILLFMLLGLSVARSQMEEGKLSIDTLLVAMIVFMPIFRLGVKIRPQLATYVLTFAFLSYLHQATKANRSDRKLWLLPILMVAWVNLHGGFLVGIALVGVHPLYLLLRPRLEEGVSSTDRGLLFQSICVAGSTFLSTLANPYGIGHWKWLYGSLSVPRPEIAEWQILLKYISQPLVLGFLLTFIALTALIAINPKRYFSFLWFAFFCIGILAFKHVRHIPLALLAGVPAALRPMDDLLRRYGTKELSDLATRQHKTLVGKLLRSILIVVVIGIALRTGANWFVHGPRSIRVNATKMPVSAVQFMKKNKIAGNVATQLNWGQYLIWHLSPASRVSIDGRYRTAYPRDVIETSYRFQFRLGAWDPMLSDYSSTLILLKDFPEGDRLNIGDQEWVRIYEDRTAVLLAKDFPANRDLLRRHVDGTLEMPEPLRWWPYFP